jgi:hypothetical protein
MLVLSVHGRDTIWVVADRRLSYGGRRRPIDDAVKIVDLDTIDGRGLLAYAGLGATARGTHPSEWMSEVLRGRGGLRFEHALKVLADAAVTGRPETNSIRYRVPMPSGPSVSCSTLFILTFHAGSFAGSLQ